MNKRTLFCIICSSFLFSSLSQTNIDEAFLKTKDFNDQCSNIGDIIVDKTTDSDINIWYEGENLNKVESRIAQLEKDIDRSELEVKYYLIMLQENPHIYSYHFYNENTKDEFGHIILHFKNKENILVDDIKILTQDQMNEIESATKNDIEQFENIPPPPPPPPPIEENVTRGNNLFNESKLREEIKSLDYTEDDFEKMKRYFNEESFKDILTRKSIDGDISAIKFLEILDSSYGEAIDDIGVFYTNIMIYSFYNSKDLMEKFEDLNRELDSLNLRKEFYLKEINNIKKEKDSAYYKNN